MREPTKKLLLSVSNAFSGFNDEEGDLTKKGMIILSPFVIAAFLVVFYLDGPAL